MIRALSTAATGMIGQEMYMDTIANNLSNVNTTGFKKNRIDFHDLIYQTIKPAGVPISENVVSPTGVQLGHGVRVVGTPKVFNQGNTVETFSPLDLMIDGDGFFQLVKSDGNIAYSRDGGFKLNSEGDVVNADGFLMEPQLTIPQDAVEIVISSDGIVSYRPSGESGLTELGQIQLARFINPAGLRSLGRNLYEQSDASGVPIVGLPTDPGFGGIYQGFLENSNVEVVQEMVDMISAQRAYEFNSKSIRSSDEMLGIAAGLKR